MAANFFQPLPSLKSPIHDTMATNKPKDSSHKPVVIAGDEEEQLFVLGRLTQARKDLNVHNLHVPDLDSIILNRAEVLERNPFGSKRDSDKAVQNVVKDAIPAQSRNYTFSGENAVQNMAKDATPAKSEENTFSGKEAVSNVVEDATPPKSEKYIFLGMKAFPNVVGDAPSAKNEKDSFSGKRKVTNMEGDVSTKSRKYKFSGEDAVPNVVGDVTSADHGKQDSLGDNAVQNETGDATPADDDSNTFSLSRIIFQLPDARKQYYHGGVGLRFDEEKKVYSVWPKNVPGVYDRGGSFTRFTFDPEEVEKFAIIDRSTVAARMKGEKWHSVMLWFVNGKVFNAEAFLRRLEEQTGSQAGRSEYA